MAGCRSYDGKQFAIPDQLYCHSDFFFDTSKFKEKGIDPAKPPQTLQELEAVAAQFDIHDGSQLMEVGFHPDVGINREMYPFAFGASFFDSKTLTVTPDHPGVIAGLQWLLAYYNKYGADNLQRIKKAYGNNQSAQNPFLSGKVAMTYFWDAMVAYRDRYAPSVEYDMAWAPYAGDHQEAKGFGNLAFNPTWMPVNAKNRDLAWDVLKFNSMDKESTIEVSIALANTPHLLTAVDAPGAAKADPILKKCWEYVAKGKMQFFPYQIPVSSDYYTAWSQQVSTILAGKVDVQAGLQQVKAMIQPKLDQALKG